MAKKEKKTKKKGKKIRKGRKHESVKIWEKYEVSGESSKRKGDFCPRCGEGVWLSKQKDRMYCGKCAYTSFSSGKAGPKREEVKPEEREEEPKA